MALEGRFAFAREDARGPTGPGHITIPKAVSPKVCVGLKSARPAFCAEEHQRRPCRDRARRLPASAGHPSRTRRLAQNGIGEAKAPRNAGRRRTSHSACFPSHTSISGRFIAWNAADATSVRIVQRSVSSHVVGNGNGC